MRYSFVLAFIFSSLLTCAQKKDTILLLGNHNTVCMSEDHVIRVDSLPATLDNIQIIMLFSGATSSLSDNDVERLIDFVEGGGGLYTGAENWPLQAESNQITNRLYLKESFGEFQQETAEVSNYGNNLKLDSSNPIPAGKSAVAFPMDYRLTVEAWIDDQPLILSGDIGKGHVILDGGYSRFYCNQRTKESDDVLFSILEFLTGG